MATFCTYCNINHNSAIATQSTKDWYWQPNSAKAGGTHICRAKKRQQCSSWEEANPEKARIKYMSARNKRRSSSHGKLRHSFSSLMSSRLSGKSKRSTFDIVSYTLEDLKKHLESKFEPGMSWDNYGAWHVDHIIPDCSFNYSSPEDEDFKKCWALANLQPLWGRDNQVKSGKIEWQR